MTGGFQCFIRGFSINVPATLKRYYQRRDRSKVKEEYSRKEFQEFLKSLGLQDILDLSRDSDYRYDDKIREKFLGEIYPNMNGFVVTLEDEDLDEESEGFKFAYLATGQRDHQYWALQAWDKEVLTEMCIFFHPSYLDMTPEVKGLINIWSQWLVLDQPVKYTMYAVSAEWTHSYVIPRD